MKKSDDPRTIILERQESNGEGGKGPKCSKKNILPNRLVMPIIKKSDVGDTICTKEDMKVVNNKGDMRYYKLTPPNIQCEK